jgi:hypothetical protein
MPDVPRTREVSGTEGAAVFRAPKCLVDRRVVSTQRRYRIDSLAPRRTLSRALAIWEGLVNVRGQEKAKRAVTTAASGSHNLVNCGQLHLPPGIVEPQQCLPAQSGCGMMIEQALLGLHAHELAILLKSGFFIRAEIELAAVESDVPDAARGAIPRLWKLGRHFLNPSALAKRNTKAS